MHETWLLRGCFLMAQPYLSCTSRITLSVHTKLSPTIDCTSSSKSSRGRKITVGGEFCARRVNELYHADAHRLSQSRWALVRALIYLLHADAPGSIRLLKRDVDAPRVGIAAVAHRVRRNVLARDGKVHDIVCRSRSCRVVDNVDAEHALCYNGRRD